MGRARVLPVVLAVAVLAAMPTLRAAGGEPHVRDALGDSASWLGSLPGAAEAERELDVVSATFELTQAGALRAEIALAGAPRGAAGCVRCAWIVGGRAGDEVVALVLKREMRNGPAGGATVDETAFLGVHGPDPPSPVFPYAAVANATARIEGTTVVLEADPTLLAARELTDTFAETLYADAADETWRHADRGPDCHPGEAPNAPRWDCDSFGLPFAIASAPAASPGGAPLASSTRGLLAAIALVAMIAAPAAIVAARARRRRKRKGSGTEPALGSLAEPVERYHRVESLPEGAFGRAWIADDARLRRRVVVKELLPRWLVDERVRSAFVREARIAGRLKSPFVVTVHDVDDSQAAPRIVMEFVEGGNLKERLARGPLPRAEALRIADEILQGLESVHAEGVTHRDLKPANILLTRDGHAKIADFGVAHVPSSTVVGLSALGEQPGTPLYMSPEQVLGDPPDARTDLYALAAILHEMLTGRHYLGVAEPALRELRELVLHAPPRIDEALPGPLRAAIERGLAKRREERFQDAAAFRRALAACAEDAARSARGRLRA